MSQRLRIAYLTPNAPYPHNRGGRIRAYHLWRALSAFGDVTPVIIGDTPLPNYRSMLRLAGAKFFPRRRYKSGSGTQIGLWELPTNSPITDSMRSELSDADALTRHFLNPKRVERLLRFLRELRPDIIYLCDTTLGPLAAHASALGVPIIVGPHNYDSDLYASMAAHAPTDAIRDWNECAAKAFDAAENLFTPFIDQLWVCSREDAGRFGAILVSPQKIKLIPNAFDVNPPSLLPETSRDLVFVGQESYYPNREAIERLLAISRRLDDKCVPHRMRIVGRTREDLRILATKSPSVEIVGEVDSVLPYIDAAVMTPVALSLGGGTRLKILEALSRARLVLSTPIGIEGIDATDEVNAIIEPDLNRFPDRIEEAFSDRARAQRIALAGWELVRDNYSHGALVDRVDEALRCLGPYRSGPSNTNRIRNIGADACSQETSFNPSNRFFGMRVEVSMAAECEDVTATFALHGQPMSSNAFIKVRRKRPGVVLLDGAAVLPPDISPKEVSLQVRAWGHEMLAISANSDLRTEAAGLMLLERHDAGIAVCGWSASREGRIISNAQAKTTSVRELSPTMNIVEAVFDSVDATVEVASRDGSAQRFSDVSTWLDDRQPTSSRLYDLKNKHAGEVAWLIGNGPSVRPEDLNCLEGRLTFCFNRFHLAHDMTRLRARYTLSGDKQMIEDFGQDIVDLSGGTVLIAHDRAPDLVGDYIWIRQLPVFPPLFSKDPGRRVSPGGSTPFVAMQLAYFMGVRKFYFYGADFSFKFEPAPSVGDVFRSVKGEGNHFISNYRSGKGWCPPSFKDISAAFLNAKILVEADGGFVRNVTRGGALEIFEREDFDHAVASE